MADIKVKGLYGGVKYGRILTTEESLKLGIPSDSPLTDQLEAAYRRNVSKNPDEEGAKLQDYEITRIPPWVKEKSAYAKNEADTRRALATGKTPDFERMSLMSPWVAKFMGYDDVMSVAHDDMDNLAAVEAEGKRAKEVRGRLAGTLSKGASGRSAAVKALKPNIKPADLAPPRPDKERPVPVGRDTPTSRFRDLPGSGLNQQLGEWFRGTALGQGYVQGDEMVRISDEAIALQARELAGGKADEAAWTALEERLRATGARPEGFFTGMIYETGKMFGQQASGAGTTTSFAAAGAIMAAVAAGALTSPVSIPVVGAAGAMAGWGIGTQAGTQFRSSKTEGGLDLIERRKLTDEHGNRLDPMAVALGSFVVGSINGIIETAEFKIAFSPMTKAAINSKAMQAVIPAVAAKISRTPAFLKIAGMAAKDWGENLLKEANAEMFQEAVPIVMDELQKIGHLGWHDMRGLREISGALTDTFMQSLYSFGITSAMGPTGATLRGDYRAELYRKGQEARGVSAMDAAMDRFKSSLTAPKLAERSGEMMRAFLDPIMDGGNFRKVYLPAAAVQTMYQGGQLGAEHESAAHWAQDVLGVSPEDFNASLADGPELEIEALKLYSTDEDVQEGLKRDVRYSPDAMSVGEAQDLELEIDALREQDLDDIKADMEREKAENTQAAAIFQTKAMELEAAGLERQVASDTAWTLSRMYVSMSRMSGLTPEDTARMFPVSFTADEGGGVYFQGAMAEYAAKLDADEAAWSDTVDRFLSGGVDPNQDIRVMDTPLVLNLVGAELLPVTITPGTMDKVLVRKHKLPPDVLKQVPRALAEPVAIFKSEEFPDTGRVALLELKNEKGSDVIVPVRLDKVKDTYTVNEITSVYGKDSKGWAAKQVAEGRLLYADTKKALYLGSAQVAGLPVSAMKESLQNNILTEADLVNARMQMGNRYYQGARGSITFPHMTGQPVRISLSALSNASTAVHELGHFYLWVLSNMESAAGHGADDLGVIKNWWRESSADIARDTGGTSEEYLRWLDGGTENERFERASHEYFARGFEAYLREGRAPSDSLRGVFRRFKKWLAELYRNMTDLDVSLSPEIRGVFDRMLATEDAIAQMRAEREADAAIAGVPYDDYPEMYEEAGETLLADLMDDISPAMAEEMSERAAELRPEIAAQVRSERVYQIVEYMAQNPEMRISSSEILDTYGDTFIAELPEGVDAPDGISLDFAVRNFDYASPDEMMNDLHGRKPADAEIDARVHAQVAREYAGPMDSTGAMDSAAEGALYSTEDTADRLAAETRIDGRLFAEELAALEADIGGQRRQAAAWIKANGKIRYSSVAEIFGKEQAKELSLRCGPGIFSQNGRGLDDMAAEMSAAGMPTDGDNALYNLLMGPDEPLSAAESEIAAREKEIKADMRRQMGEFKDAERAKYEQWRKDTRERTREWQDKKRARYDEMNEALKERAAQLKEDTRAKRDALEAELKSKYGEQAARLKAGWDEKQAAEKQQKALARYWERVQRADVEEARKAAVQSKEAARAAAESIVSGYTIERIHDPKSWIRAEKTARHNGAKMLREAIAKARQVSREMAAETAGLDPAQLPMDSAEYDKHMDAYRAAKERELLAHSVVKEMYRARKEAERVRKWVRRYELRKASHKLGVPLPYRQQIDALLSRFMLTKKKSDAEIAAPSLAEFVEEMNREHVPVLVPAWVLRSGEQVHYTRLTMPEFEEVRDVIKNILTVGRDAQHTISGKERERVEDIAEKILHTSQKFWVNVTGTRILDPAEKKIWAVAEYVPGFMADNETTEAICRTVDGFTDIGPAHQHIFQPLRDATTRETLAIDAVYKHIRDETVRIYGGMPKLDGKAVVFENIPMYAEKAVEVQPGVWQKPPSDKKLSLTREEIICAALNMGNDDNIQRLQGGWGWTDDDMSEIVSALSEQDAQYVQMIWDTLESLWPRIKEVHELMTGLELQKVAAKPLETAHGTLTGGYYPIVTDHRYSDSAAESAERADVMASASLNYASTYTKHGHRKERAQNVLNRPPKLSIGILDTHFVNVIHDIEMSPALRGVRKVFKNPTVRNVIRQSLSENHLRVINKWLNDVAGNTKNNNITPGHLERGISAAKRNFSMYALGLNLVGAGSQLLGYFPLADRIGYARTARAIIGGMEGRGELYDFVYQKSAFMREQSQNTTIEIRNLKRSWSVTGKGLSPAIDWMMSIYPLCQNMVNVPGWAECYKMGLAKFGDEQQAIYYADSVIRQTQSASSIADLTTLERSGLHGQLFTMFFSWFRVMYQMQTEAIRKAMHMTGIKRWQDLASYAFTVLLMQGIADNILRGDWPDEDESWVKWAFSNAALNALSPIPVARDFASVYNYRFTPLAGAFNNIWKMGKTWAKVPSGDKEIDDALFSTAEALGGLSGIPNRTMIRAAKIFWENFDEDKAIPWAYLVLGGKWQR